LKAWTNQEEVFNEKKSGTGTYCMCRSDKVKMCREKKTFLFFPLQKVEKVEFDLDYFNQSLQA
jgi:hypothetical protein